MTASVLSESELRDLLRREEGQFLEFKSVWDRAGGAPMQLKRRAIRDTIAEYVAAFANADGGLLLVGVEDDGQPSGHPYPEEAIAEFLAVPERRLRPATRCDVSRVSVDGKEIIAFDVRHAAEAVMVDGNGFPYRVGDQVVREPQEVINQRKEAYRRVGYEQRIRGEASIDDLDLDLATKFLARTPYGKRPVEEVLERYALIQASASGWRITNAGLLLFAKVPLSRWHPRAGVRMFRVAGNRRQHGGNRNVTQLGTVDLPVAAAIPEAHRIAREHIRRSEKLHDLFFKEVPEYPEFAWQEAIVNAVAHRDYEVQGREVEVWFYEDRMEVWSPGQLVVPVTIEALRDRRPVHASRNPLLVRVLADAGIMRDEGEGIPRIFEEMEASLLREPELSLEDGTFRIVLRNEPIFVGPSAGWQKLVQGLSIKPEHKRALLAHPQGFTNEEYRRLNAVDRDEAYRQIQELVDTGIVVASGKSGRGSRYRISSELREARGFLEARLPKLREYFARSPVLKNADYRALFGVTRRVALNELQRLVAEGFLSSEGERRGAHYRPLSDLNPDRGEK
ncbi:MAG: putative DNA binding domain-containing protein [Sandaracinus sp.]|nr:putative DNA binding domain-containing protein [Sandaracinus sp.]